jgi:hypothetical protein
VLAIPVHTHEFFYKNKPGILPLGLFKFFLLKFTLNPFKRIFFFALDFRINAILYRSLQIAEQIRSAIFLVTLLQSFDDFWIKKTGLMILAHFSN